MDKYHGRHLRVWRGAYFHHGIGDGRGGVIHHKLDACVHRVSLEAFADGSEIVVIEHAAPKYGRAEAARRAESLLGEDHYDLLCNNCEHLVNWCIMGEGHSTQVIVGGSLIGGMLGGALAGAVAGAKICRGGGVAGAAIGVATGAAVGAVLAVIAGDGHDEECPPATLPEAWPPACVDLSARHNAALAYPRGWYLRTTSRKRSVSTWV